MHCPGSDPARAKRTPECGTCLVYVHPGRVANPGVSRAERDRSGPRQGGEPDAAAWL